MKPSNKKKPAKNERKGNAKRVARVSPPKEKPSLKLSTKQEAAMRKVYDAYWDNYIKGDVKALAALLDDDYRQVGSAETEVFFNKKDAVTFLKDTINEVAGKVEMRNRVTKVEPLDQFVLVHELCDLYALSGKKWIFYSRFRASSVNFPRVRSGVEIICV